MSIFDQALDLGRGIAGTHEYDSMQKAEQAVMANPDARRAVTEFQDLQQSFYRMRMQGNELTEEDMKRLRESEDKAMGIEEVREYYQARMRFHEIVEKVNAKIQEGITGICADHGHGGG